MSSMSKRSVSADQLVPANIPVGSLNDEEDIHVEPSRRLLWPSLVHNSSDIHTMTAGFQGRIWIELGFSAWSLIPFARNQNLYLAYDERPWVKTMMDRSHSRRVIDAYTCTDHRFSETPGTPVMQALAKSCTALANDVQIGLAFFIISRLRGASRIYDTLERSIDCSAIKEQKAQVLARPYSLAPVYLKPKDMTNIVLLQEIGRLLVDKADAFHININRNMGDESPNIAKSLNSLGFSWSMAISESQRTIARAVSSVLDTNVIKVGEYYYASRG